MTDPWEKQERHEMQAEREDELMAENAKLKEFARLAWELLTCNEPCFVWSGMVKQAKELGFEVLG